jgi:hypothetical protein
MFQETKFGMVKFADKTYNYDIMVHQDGTVNRRDKNISKKKKGSSHIIAAEEVKIITDENPEILVVGSGQSGRLKVEDDARDLLSSKDIELIILPTKQAIIKYNELKNQNRRITGIIHVTC